MNYQIGVRTVEEPSVTTQEATRTVPKAVLLYRDDCLLGWLEEAGVVVESDELCWPTVAVLAAARYKRNSPG